MLNLNNLLNFIINGKFDQYYDIIDVEIVYFLIAAIFAAFCDDVDHGKWSVTGIIGGGWLMVKQVSVWDPE